MKQEIDSAVNFSIELNSLKLVVKTKKDQNSSITFLMIKDEHARLYLSRYIFVSVSP